MRSFFDLANHLDGAEKVIDREIRILVTVYMSIFPVVINPPPNVQFSHLHFLYLNRYVS